MAYRSLVTGGCGFIGRHLVEALRARGDQVRVLDVRPWIADSEDPGIEPMRGSITDAATVQKAMSGVDRVFHLAANPNLWAPDPRLFHEVNYLGTCRVLEAADRLAIERLIYTSTESILKSCRAPRRAERVVIDETARQTLPDMPGPYCRSKFRAEEAAHAAAAGGMPVVIVNPTMPLGPGDATFTPPTKMVLGFLNGTTPAFLGCEFNLVDARDAALGHILAAERGRIGQRYILGAENIELCQLLEELTLLTGLAMPRFRVPYGLAFVAALVSEALAKITKRPPTAPLTGVRLARSSMAFNCSKARRELGWQPRPLRETLRDTVTWLRSTGVLRRDVALPKPDTIMADERRPSRRGGKLPAGSWIADRDPAA